MSKAICRQCRKGYWTLGWWNMLTYEIVDSKLADEDPEHVVQVIEENIVGYGLDISQKTTLSTMRGSIHYHLKQGKVRGVLEITYWPLRHRLLVEVHDNRQAEWNLFTINAIAKALALRFDGRVIVHKTT